MNQQNPNLDKIMNTSIDITSVEVDSYNERKKQLAEALDKLDKAFIAKEIKAVKDKAQGMITARNEQGFEELTEFAEALKVLNMLQDLKDWDAEFKKLVLAHQNGRVKFDYNKLDNVADRRYGHPADKGDDPKLDLRKAIDALMGALDKLLIIIDYAESGLKIKDPVVKVLVEEVQTKVKNTYE